MSSSTLILEEFEGYKISELGLIPEEWHVVRLKDVVQKTEQRDPRKIPDWRFKYVDVSSIDRERLRIVEHKLFEGKNAPSRARKPVKNRDVIFATVRPTLKRTALIDEEFDGEMSSTAFCVLRAKEGVLSPAYLFYAVSTDRFVGELGRIQRGASYPAVTDSDVKNQRIPFPPLPEQERIAGVLSAVQETKEKTEEVIRAAKELKKSLMKYLFTYGPVPVEEAAGVPLKETELGLLPGEWRIKPASEVFTRVTDGTHDTPKKLSQGIPLVTSKLIKEGKVLINDADYFISEQDHQTISNRSGVDDWDILYSMIGTLGETAPVKPEYPSFSIKNVGLFKTGKNRLSAEFTEYFMQSEKAKNFAMERASGTTQKYVPLALLRRFPIPLPPIQIQKMIRDIFSVVDKKIEAEQNRRRALEELFNTLLGNLMTAKIRVNDLEVRA